MKDESDDYGVQIHYLFDELMQYFMLHYCIYKLARNHVYVSVSTIVQSTVLVVVIYIIPNPHQCREMTCETVHTIPFLQGLDQRLEKGRGSYGAVYEVKLNGLPCIAKGLHEILLG